jgi:protein-tyrosine phosphatase
VVERPYRITVVCLGNICRSPIGEAVLRDRIERAGLGMSVQVDSAGTGDWHIGHDADPRALRTLESGGYRLQHRARQIDASWLPEIDLLLAMDASNYSDLRRMGAPAEDATLRMFRSFDPELAHFSEPSDALTVPDPYYGAADGFVEVLRMIEAASDGLVAQLPGLLTR